MIRVKDFSRIEQSFYTFVIQWTTNFFSYFPVCSSYAAMALLAGHTIEFPQFVNTTLAEWEDGSVVFHVSWNSFEALGQERFSNPYAVRHLPERQTTTEKRLPQDLITTQNRLTFFIDTPSPKKQNNFLLTANETYESSFSINFWRDGFFLSLS